MMKQGLFQLVYFTFLHNSLAIGLAVAAGVALLMLIKRPQRKYVFFFVGFLILLFQFEYDKHIVKDLAEQTVGTVFLEEGNYRARWLTQAAIYHLVPTVLWVVGWGGVVLGVLDPDFGKMRGWKKENGAQLTKN
jgi:4-hydroxybenzoate polyprenyltransferase